MVKTYSIREAAEMMGCSYSYLAKLLRENKLQHHRFSERHIFFTEDDIKANIDNSLVLSEKSV